MASGDLPLPSFGSQTHVILVEPGDARNVGAVARAMSNLGFTSLRLVNPIDYKRDVAIKVACWGAELLDTATIFTNINDAVADLKEVVGFSSLQFKHRPDPETLDRWLSSNPVQPGRPVGLLFGPEDTGLRKEHLPVCQSLVRIPSVGENRSYNLAQSVLLVLFSLRGSEPQVQSSTTEQSLTSGQLASLETRVLHVAELAGYIDDDSRPHIPDVLRNLVRRSRTSESEASVLLGVLGRIERALLGKVPVSLHGCGDILVTTPNCQTEDKVVKTTR